MPDKKYLALGILSVSLLTIMAGAAVSPALADILENVEGANPTLTKMVLTVPALFIIPTSYAVGRWSGEISKKKLVLFAILLYSFAGSAAYYVTDIYSLLVTRALVGVSVGITMPSITALIADFYEGPDRFRMMSFNNVAANFGGIIATFLSGLLASISWNYAFLVYLTGLPVLIVAAIFIKDPDLNYLKSLYLDV
jgi:MFS family permease